MGKKASVQLEDLDERLKQRAAVLKATICELRLEIAQHAAVEQALRDEHNRCRTLVETIPHGIVEFDTNGTITFANAEFHRLHGYPEGTLTGKCLWDVLKTILPNARDIIQTNFREQPTPATQYNSFHDSIGKCIDHKVDWNYERDANGNIIGMVAIITDITRQRRAEEEARHRLDQLAHVTRVFTMNQMLSGMAHELNQPLAAIANYAQVCQYRLQKSTIQDREMLLDSIEQISNQADRAGQIIRRLRDFVRRADSSRSRENINDIVGEVMGMLEIDARTHKIHLETILAPDMPRVAVDRIQIEQVITNLLKNAMEATRDPSELGHVILRTEINEDGMLELSVTDAGKGVDAEEISKLFEPFYTTKQSGMGLGLSISRSIVEAHGGHLEAVKNASRGMTFRFTLPVAAEEGKT